MLIASLHKPFEGEEPGTGKLSSVWKYNAAIGGLLGLEFSKV